MLIKNLSRTHLILAIALSSQLAACVPLVVGGAATGGSIVADRRTSGIYVEDQNIEIKAEKMIAEQLGDKIHVNIISYNLNVLMTGEADDAKSKTKAEEIVTSISHVKSVTNELMVGAQTDLSSRSNDAYITTKVKANMINDGRFSANAVKVFTERSIVYLMGIVSHKEADLAVEVTRGVSDVDKVVKVFEYTD